MALVPRPAKRAKLESTLDAATDALVVADGPFSMSERDALIRAVEACAAALYEDAEQLPASVGRGALCAGELAASPRASEETPEFCRMALRLVASAGALRSVPPASSRGCSRARALPPPAARAEKKGRMTLRARASAVRPRASAPIDPSA